MLLLQEMIDNVNLSSSKYLNFCFIYFFKEKILSKVAALKFRMTLLADMEKSIGSFPNYNKEAAQVLRDQINNGVFDLDTSKNSFLSTLKISVLNQTPQTKKLPSRFNFVFTNFI